MKVSFSGETLEEVHHQIIKAAAEIAMFRPSEGPKSNVSRDVMVSPQEVFGDPEAEQAAKNWEQFRSQPIHKAGIPQESYVAKKADLGVETDSTGAAWDPTIHSSSKVKTSHGVWKKRRGGEATNVVKPTGGLSAPLADAPANVAAIQRAEVQNAVPEFAQGPAPIGMAPNMYNVDSFGKNLQMIIVRLVNEKKISREYLQTLNQHFQVVNLWDVNKDPAKLKSLFDSFVEWQFITGV